MQKNYQIKNRVCKTEVRPLYKALAVLALSILIFFTFASSSALAVESTFTTSLTTTGLSILPPPVPANLNASAVSDTQIDLSWSASTPNYYPIAGYRIFRDSVILATTSSTIYSDTGLTQLTGYSYTVEAFDSLFQMSGRSATSTATTTATPLPSPSPTTGGGGSSGGIGTRIIISNVKIIPGTDQAEISFTTNVQTQTKVQWGFSGDYEIGSLQNLFYGFAHTQIINGLVQGLTYKVRITANDSNGATVYKDVDFTTVLPITELGPLPNPTDFLATAKEKEIELTWKNPTDSRFNDVRIVRTEGFYPIDEFDGIPLYEGDGESFVDTTALPGVTYYYAIFSRDRDMEYSSGALAQARIAIPGEPVVAAITDPFANLPQAKDVDPMIRALTLADFEFIQDEKILEVVGETVAISGDKNLTIRLRYNKVPEILKTVAFTLQDPNDKSKVFPFLLRVNNDKTYYEATIGALGRSGRYGMSVVILDYQNNGLMRLNGTLAALAFTAPLFDFGKNFDLFGLLILLLVILLLILAIMLLRKLVQYSTENKKSKYATPAKFNTPSVVNVSMKKFIVSVFLIAFAQLFIFNFISKTPNAFAAYNPEINYQGKLVTSTNSIVPDGNYNIRFKLYTSRTGGSPIWTETWCNTSDCAGTGTGTDDRIAISNGLFSTMLGSTTAFTGIDFNQSLYLGVEIGGSGATAVWDGEMSPRKILGAVPAAFYAGTSTVALSANKLSGLNAEQFFRTDAQNATSSATTFLNVLQTGAGKIAEFFGSASQSVLALLSNGNVGIGTSTPGSKLTLAGGNFTHTASGTPTLAGTYNTSGNANGVFVSGKYAYVADSTSGLQIIDISNPSNPTLTGTYNTSGNANGVFVSGKYAYVADGASGLQIIDISNPSNPTLTGTYNTTGSATGVYVSGKYVYVADRTSGIQIIDISKPSLPTLLGTYNTNGEAYAIYISGKYAYVADYDFGLQIIDISNPINPTLTGTYNTSGEALGVYVSGKYAYVADTDPGLQIIDISNPANPTLSGTYDTSGFSYKVYVSGKYAYVADFSSGLQVIDISNSTVPVLVGTYDTSDAANGIYVSGKYAYVADGASGLQIIDINGIETPSLYAGNINTNDITVTENIDVGNNLFVRNGLNVGTGGIFTDGVLSVAGTSSSYFGGNLGLGTTSPNWKLSVAGIGSFDDYVRASYFTATSTTATSTFPNLSLTRMLFGSDYLTDITGTGLSITNNALTVTGASILGAANMLASFDSSGNLTSTSSPQVAYINATSTTATSTFAGGMSVAGATGLSVLQNGSVGIGTINPGSKLEVVGDIISKGTSWTARSAAGDNDGWVNVTYGNGLFVAVGNSGDRVMTSPDGINWTARSAVGNDDSWTSVTYGNGLFVAVGSDGDRVMTSSDGINWTARSAAGDNDVWRYVTYGNGLFVAVGDFGDDLVMTSPDGINWTARSATGNDDAWYGVTYGNGLFVVVGGFGADNNLITSPDGINWTAQTAAGNDDNWYSVTYGNGTFVAVGSSGDRVITSPNGINWTVQNAAGNDDSWVNVTYGNGLFVAVGSDGDRVISSPDGINWTIRSAAGNNDTWYGVTYGNGTFVAVGSSGDRVMTSGKPEQNVLAHNNTYQGGMNIFGNLGLATTSPWRTLSVNGSSDLGTNALAGYFTATSTTASTFPYASTTALTVSGTNGLQLATGLNGPLQANNGLVSATTSIGVLYGGTGLSTAPTYGQLLLGNASSGYTLTSTSSLGISLSSIIGNFGNSWELSNNIFSESSLSPTTTQNIAISGIGTSTFAGGLEAWRQIASPYFNATSTTATSTFAGGMSVAGVSGLTVLQNGNVGVGTTSPASKLHVWGTFQVGTSTTPTMTVDTAMNKVGIGVAPSSSYSLYVNGATNIVGSIYATSFIDRATTQYFLDPGSSGTSLSVAGYVGIGTTSPYAKLSVVGQVVGEYFTATSTTATSTFPNLSLTNLLFGSDYLTDITGSGLTISNNALTVTGASILGAANMLASFDSSGNLTSTSSPQVAYINATSTTATSTFAGGLSVAGVNGLNVLQNGSIGIGTINPGSKLEVVGDIISKGTSWTARSAAGDNDSWVNITYGNGLFVAVGYDGDRVMTSPDGINWTARSAAGNNDGWTSVTYGNGLFVAVGNDGDRVMTSPDGINWTARSAAGDDDGWFGVTYGNGLFVAVGDTGDRVMTSPDGINWTAQSAAGNNDSWYGLTYSNGLFVAVSNLGDRVMTSPDGINWTAQSAAGNNDGWIGVTYGNGLFVAVGNSGDRVMTSPDGINWTAQSAAGDDDSWYGVTYGNGLFVAVGYDGDRVMTSPDGINWTARSATGDNDEWYRITYANGLFVAVGNVGDRVMTSGKIEQNVLVHNNIYQGGMNIFGNLTIGTLNGPLQANNGLVSATTSIGVLYGGTGLSTAPTYGQLLVGNASSGYTLSATSSLGLLGSTTVSSLTANYIPKWNTSTFANSLLYDNGTNVGVGINTPGRNLDVAGSISINNNLLTQTEGGLYYGRVKITENQLAINSNSFGLNWTARGPEGNWKGITLSSDGKYQSAVLSGDKIYTSSDYGRNWTGRDSNRAWESISMSSDGKYQSAMENWGKIYTSSDYGLTWTPRDSDRNWFNGIAVSSDGKYQSAIESGGQIYTSSDYGATWTPRDSNRSWYDVAVSSDGKYQTAVAESGKIYTSYDYGATWTPRDSNRSWYGVDMSSDGKYQSAVTEPGLIYTSSDYGVNWTGRDSNRQWYGIAVSSDGKYQSAVVNGGRIYISTDFGLNWSARGLSKDWYGIAMSSDGKYQSATVGVGGSIYTSYTDSFISGGNFAIGTSSPYSTFSVWGGGTDTNRIFELTNSASTTLASFLENGTGYFSGNIGVGTTSPWRTLSVNGSSDLGTNALAGYFTATTSTASTFPYASTTALTVSGTNGLQLASGLNGLLQAVNGLVQSSSTLSVAYGGTGLSTAPTYGQLLVGDGAGNYSLTGTSTLGIMASSAIGMGTQGFIPYYASGAQALTATSSIFISQNSYLGIGTTTPTSALSVFSASAPQFQLAYNKDNYLKTSVSSSGGVTMAVNGSLGGFAITNSQPTAVQTGTGTDAPLSFSVTGGIGGNSLDTNAAVGGIGGGIQLNAGVGGTVSLATVSETGGAGGTVTVNGGAGGDASAPSVDFMTRVAGAGGALTFAGGTGGNASNGGLISSNTAGAGGIFILKGGTGGNASGATTNNGGAGGSLYLSGGPGGTGSTANGTAGNLYLGYDSLSSIGNVYFGNQNVSYIGSTGNLGLGTTSPWRTLSVNGSSDLGTNALAGYFTATTSTASTFPYASTTALTVSGTNGLQLATGLNGPLQANNGLVSATTSIGVLYGGTGLTTAPSYGQLLLGNASSGYTLSATSSLGLLGSSTISSLTTNYIPKWNTSTFANSLLYDDGTNIGIGTTSPYAKLSIHARATDTYNPTLFSIASSTSAYATSTLFTVLANGNVGIGTSSPSAFLDIYNPVVTKRSIEVNQGSSNGKLGIFFNDTGGNSNSRNWAFGNSISSGYGWDTTRSSVAGGLALTLSTRIDNNGNFGIGPTFSLTAPIGSRLSVIGGVSIGSLTYATTTAPANGMIVEGNVGIGTTSPYAKLSVTNTSTTQPAFALYGFNSQTSPLMLVASTTGSATSTAFIIDSNGLVGIGTTTPYTQLSVSGGVAGQYFNADSSTGTSTFKGGMSVAGTSGLTVLQNGNVGIGTVTPANTLQVNGLSRLNSGMKIGTSAGLAYYIFPFAGISYSTPSDAGTNLSFFSYSNIGNNFGIVFTGDTVLNTSLSYSNFVVPRGFAPTSGNGQFNVFHILSTVNQTGGASGISRGLYINPTLTSAADWRSIQWDNNTGYGLYGAGTSNNYLAGNLGLATTSPYAKLSVTNTSTTQPAFALYGFNSQTSPLMLVASTTGSATSTAFIIDSNGLVGIGTTSPSQQLSVAGNGYFTGSLLANSITGTSLNIGSGLANMLAGFDSSGNLTSTSSPQVAYINATSSTATSTFAGGLSVAGTSGLTVLQNGNVGIGGPASAVTKLAVTGALSVSSNSTVSGTLASIGFIVVSTGATMNIAGSGNTISTANRNGVNFFSGPGLTSSTFTQSSGTGAGVSINPVYNQSGSAGNIDLLIQRSETALGSGSQYLIAGQVGGSLNSYSTSTQFFIDKTGNQYLAGNLGLSTTSPFAKLSVTNTSTTQPALAVYGFNSQTSPLMLVASTTGSATSTAFIIDSNGLVGIGTTTPYTQLSVQGGIAGQYFNADSSTATSTFAGGLSVAGTSGLTVLQNGNVGIGKVNPTAKLDVSGTLTVNGIASFSGTYLSASKILTNTLGPNGDSNFSFVDFNSVANVTFAYKTSNSLKGVGIGTTTPAWMLQVASSSASATMKGQLALTDTGAGTNLKHWLFSSMGGNLYISTSSDAYATSTIAALTVNSNGLVGIGTTTPYTQLSVAGGVAGQYFNADSSTATSTFAGGLSVAGSTGFTVQSSSGRIGVGTNNPQVPFHLTASDARMWMLSNTSSGNYASLVFGEGTGSGQYGGISRYSNASASSVGPGATVFFSRNKPLALSTSESFTTISNSALYIDTSNNIGISSTSPSARLSINQGATGQGFYLAGYANNTSSLFMVSSSTASATSTAFIIDSNGKVGIGTTSPAGTLGLNGNLFIGGTATSTIEGNLDVLNTLHALTSYTGDLFFANNFSFTETLPINGTTTQALYLKNQNGNKVMDIDDKGNLNITGDICSKNVTCVNESLNKLSADLGALASSTIGIQDGINGIKNTSSSVQSLADAIVAMDLKVEALIASSTINTDLLITSTSIALASSTDFINKISSSTATVLNSDTGFIGSLANAVKNILSSAQDWVVDRFTAKVAYINRVEAETVAISKGMEIIDQVSGATWCVTIKNGDWNKVMGACASLASTTPAITPAPVVLPTPVIPIDPASIIPVANQISTTTSASTLDLASSTPKVEISASSSPATQNVVTEENPPSIPTTSPETISSLTITPEVQSVPVLSADPISTQTSVSNQIQSSQSSASQPESTVSNSQINSDGN